MMTQHTAPPQADREPTRILVENAARRLAYGAQELLSRSAEIAAAGELVAHALSSGKRAYIFGNGGSAACATHFAAEFTGKLKEDRPPLPVVSLTTDASALTAIANDYGFDHVYARQITALARPGDVVIGLSTSGRSENVRRAFLAAHEAGAETLALVGTVDELGARRTVHVGVSETARVQELHDLILHEIAQVTERVLFADLPYDSSASRFGLVLEGDELAQLRDWADASGQSIVSTNGVFDLLHDGHIASLQAAKREGDRLVVLINGDESVRRLKGDGRPIRPLEDRIRDLGRVMAVDHVVVMDDLDPRRLLGLLRPDAHAKGAEYAEGQLLEAETVIAGGGRIVYLDRVAGYSTSSQIERTRA